MVAGENFGRFGEFEAIRQSFTHLYPYYKTVSIVSVTNQIP